MKLRETEIDLVMKILCLLSRKNQQYIHKVAWMQLQDKIVSRLFDAKIPILMYTR